MSTISPDLVNQLGLTSYAGNATVNAVKNTSNLGQEDFLKLLSTQLNNQDPTQPMDNSQFLAQIAQFASVTGIQDMQNSLKQLAGSLISNQTMQAASLVDHEVVASGANAVLGQEGSLSGAVDLSQTTNQLLLGIYDGAGQLVRKINYGPQSKGLMPVSWDGITDSGARAQPGIYTIRAEALVDGSPQAMGTYVASRVDSVMVDAANQQIMLNLSNGETIGMSEIKQIM